MPKPRTITPTEEARIRECLKLDPGSPSGLTWRIDRRRATPKAGDYAGSLATQGCGHQSWVVGLGGRIYRVHSIVWLLLHDQWPADLYPLTIDHINRDGSDNSHDNIRLATQNQQKNNRGTFGTSSCKYVTRHKRAQKWMARWRHPVTKRLIHVGSYSTELEAHRAALASRLENYDLLTGEWLL